MHVQDIKQMIEASIDGSEARVSGDGSHFEAVVVSGAFTDKSMLEKQKMVYAALGEHITSGAIHALTIKTYTPKEWETAQKLTVTAG
ncbi:MAG: BolA family iron metabolism protein IbaG [Gammaproteobacteria bacterium]|nr:MAG: BolA family iron metabolism protein IbaG [Gammaproteobacteria bacterium]